MTCKKKDLTNKLSHPHKENTAPNQVPKIKTTPSRNSRAGATSSTSLSNGGKKRMSMSDVSDMLYEIYKANAAAKVPKSQGAQQQPQSMAVGATAASQTLPNPMETNEPPAIAAMVTSSPPAETVSKNLTSDGMMTSKLTASFHPRIKSTADFSDGVPAPDKNNECNIAKMTAIPTSVVVPTTSAIAEPLDIKPIIHPTTGLIITPNPSVIKPVPVANTATNPQAAAIAAALIRDGYHNFQQQIRAQELIKFHTNKINKNLKVEDTSATKILETFLRQQRNSECDTDTASDNNNDGDDEDDSRYNGFEDIHLVEGTSKAQFPHLLQNVMAKNSSPATTTSNEYYSDESQKYINLAAQAQAQALINLDFQFGDFASSNMNDGSNMTPSGIGADGEPVYECRHCGKKYRWKSTLRRHENVECGGKEPSHQCPYCPYKSKQRGNLGVHVRKHHANLPQLASKRRSKYSMKFDANSAVKHESSNGSNANVSDDSNSKLIIDCSK